MHNKNLLSIFKVFVGQIKSDYNFLLFIMIYWDQRIINIRITPHGVSAAPNGMSAAPHGVLALQDTHGTSRGA